MNNERIDLTQFEGMTVGPWVSEEWDEGKILGPISEIHNNSHPIIAVVGDGWWGDMLPECDANKRAMAAVPDLIAELKKCYEELDSLPTRWQMSQIHNYTKWLETVESYFLADGSFNQDADFVRKCAVNEQYGYRIEVIDGVETVVHESE